MSFTSDGKFNLQMDQVHTAIKDTAQAIINDGKQRTIRISVSNKGMNGNITETFGVVRNITGTKAFSRMGLEPSHVKKLVEEHISFLEAMGYGTDINVMEMVLNAFEDHIASRQRYNREGVDYFGNVFIELGFPRDDSHFVVYNIDTIARVDDVVQANKTHTVRFYHQGTRVFKISSNRKGSDDSAAEMK